MDQFDRFDAAAAVRSFYETYAAAQGKPRWGEKTPQYLRMMGRIARTLPEARFVHIIRDGRDVALSLLAVEWGPTTVTGAAEQWVDEIRTARRKVERVPHYMEARFVSWSRTPSRCSEGSASSSTCPSAGDARLSPRRGGPDGREGARLRDRRWADAESRGTGPPARAGLSPRPRPTGPAAGWRRWSRSTSPPSRRSLPTPSSSSATSSRPGKLGRQSYRQEVWAWSRGTESRIASGR